MTEINKISSLRITTQTHIHIHNPNTQQEISNRLLKDELFCAMAASLKTYLGKNSHLVRKP